MLKFLHIIFSFFVFSQLNADILLWSITDAATVDGQSVCSFISPLPDDDDNWPGARVKITGGSLTEPIILNVWGEEDGQSVEYTDGMGVWIGGNGEFFSSEWVQSSVGPDGAHEIDREMLGELMFVMELGQNIDVTFTVIAQTLPTGGSDFIQNYVYPRFDLNPLTATPWEPVEFYT